MGRIVVVVVLDPFQCRRIATFEGQWSINKAMCYHMSMWSRWLQTGNDSRKIHVLWKLNISLCVIYVCLRYILPIINQ
jgi:hypothetical protein